MRQAGVEGEVLVRYVIDTSGGAVRDSIKVIRSTHELFTTAVKNAMPLLRFASPRRAGVAVNVVMEEVVTFHHPGFQNGAVRPEQLSQRRTDSTGRLVTTVYALLPRDSVNAPVLTKTDSLEIYYVVIEELIRSQDAKQLPAAWCINLAGRDPSSDLFARWRRGARRMVGMKDCPRSYDSMVYSEWAPKPPAGWVDPVIINVGSMVSWAEDRVVLTAQAHQGYSGTLYRCEAGRVAGKWSDVYCMPTGRSIS